MPDEQGNYKADEEKLPETPLHAHAREADPDPYLDEEKTGDSVEDPAARRDG